MPSCPSEPLELPDLQGQCQLRQVALLAEGGMSLTWLMHRAGDPANHLFVLKQLHPRLEENHAAILALQTESALSATLRHQRLVQGHQACVIGGKLYMPMEFVLGDNLLAIFQQTSRADEEFPLGLTVHLGLQLAEALTYIHAQRDDEGNTIVHRDVSPQNILVGYDGNVRLIDFGVASPTRLLGQLHGKFPYMSPEQVLGMPVTPASDIFSMGTILWEACAQRRLFHSRSPIESARRIASVTIPTIESVRAGVPPAFDVLLRRALSLDSAARPTADEFYDALLAIDARLRLTAPETAAFLSFYTPQARERLDLAALRYFRRPLPEPAAFEELDLGTLSRCAIGSSTPFHLRRGNRPDAADTSAH